MDKFSVPGNDTSDHCCVYSVGEQNRIAIILSSTDYVLKIKRYLYTDHMHANKLCSS